MAVESIAILQKLSPSTSASRVAEIDAAIKKYAAGYGLTNNKRLAAFLAQGAEETGGFRVLKEIWGPSAWQVKYEGHKGLGNTQPGDGKKFLGRGIFQTTGRANYQKASQHLFGDNRLLSNPEILEQPEYAVKSAMFFWQSNNLNRFADKDDFSGLTRVLNGPGMLNYDVRQRNWALLKQLLAITPFAFMNEILKKKSSKSEDGWFGSVNNFFDNIHFFITGKHQ